jgi:hypothetical protein
LGGRDGRSRRLSRDPPWFFPVELGQDNEDDGGTGRDQKEEEKPFRSSLALDLELDSCRRHELAGNPLILHRQSGFRFFY